MVSARFSNDVLEMFYGPISEEKKLAKFSQPVAVPRVHEGLRP